MKIPTEWLKEYINTAKSTQDLAKSFTALGLMLDKPISTYTNSGYTTELLDLEHRLDRSDWLSILGCARDLAAFENTELTLPKINTAEPKKPLPEELVTITVECPDVVRRFNTRVFRGIKVGKSPEWLKNRLEAYGIPSINNIVDITNYVMVEVGQPMHAQDLAKFAKQEIVIRKAFAGEEITTLLGETLKLTPENFVLTQNGKATVLGGIVGGKETGITAETTDIILDAGNYNHTNIRKASRKLKVQNESVLRNDKLLHPNLTQFAMQRASQLILELAGGTMYANVDWTQQPFPEKQMNLRYKRLALLSGMEFNVNLIKTILTKLGYAILAENKDDMALQVPYFRTDVEVEDDIIADILRIAGYATIPTQLPANVPPAESTPAIYLFEEQLRDICTKLHLHEHITQPLVQGAEDPNQILLENSQSSEKNALRTTMKSGLANVAAIYHKAQVYDPSLFEIGKVYTLDPTTDGNKYSSYKETRRLQVFMDNAKVSRDENSKQLRSVLSGLLLELSITTYNLLPKQSRVTIEIQGKDLGELDYNSFWLDIEALMPIAKTAPHILDGTRELRTEDISVIAKKELLIGNLVTAIKETCPSVISVVCNVEDIEKVVGMGNKAILFTITYNSKIVGTAQAFSKQEINKVLADRFKVKVRE